MLSNGGMVWLKTGDTSFSEAKTLPLISSSILRNSAAGSQTSQVIHIPSCITVTFVPFWLSHSCFWPLRSAPAKQCVAAGGDEDAQIKSIIELLVRKGFIRRVDRMYKKPKPGKKRLAKWPKKLVPVRDRELQVAAPCFCSCTRLICHDTPMLMMLMRLLR